MNDYIATLPSAEIHSRSRSSNWKEPTLEEMLADPIIQARMSADGVTIGMVRCIMAGAVSRRRRIPL